MTNVVQNSKKPIIFLVHGFKTVTWNNYDDFADWFKQQNQPKPDLFTYDYYDNNDKSTLKAKLMWSKNVAAFKKIVALNREIIIVGYSSGAPIATRLINTFPEAKIKNIFFIAPAFKISLLFIFQKFCSGKWKKIHLWFKMNKKQRARYRRFSKNAKKQKTKSQSVYNVHEHYLYHIVWAMLRLQRHCNSALKQLDLKKINIYYGGQEETVPMKKNLKFIYKATKKHHPEINTIKMKNKTHVTIFTSGNTSLFKEIIK